MTQIERLKLRLGISGITEDEILTDILESVQNVILMRRFPYGTGNESLEVRYLDLQIRIAIEMYNRIGAEGETTHSENGISRSYGSDFISDKLLQEITPRVGVL